MKGILRLLSIVTLFLPFQWAQAQSGFNSPTPEERQHNREAKEKYWEANRTEGIESKTIEAQNFKNGQPIGDFQSSMTYYYNYNGQDIKQSIFNPKGKLTLNYLYEFDQDGNRTTYTIQNKKGNPLTREEYEFEEGKMTTMRSYSFKKSDPKFHREYGYDEGDKLIRSTQIKTRNNKLTHSWNFTYYEDGSKKRTEKLNRKNKIVSATDYSCDKAGTEIASGKVDQQVVCKRTELDDAGKQITIIETMYGEKNMFRSVSKLNSFDRVYELTFYDESGVVTTQFLTDYNEAGQVIATKRYGLGGKFDRASTYERNSKGNVTSETVFNEREEVVMKLRYTYTYFK